MRPMMSTSHVTISEIATLTSSIASPTLDLKLLRSGMPTFQHATMRSSLPGVEAPAWGVKGGGMAPASKGAGHCERGGLCERGGRVGTMKMDTGRCVCVCVWCVCVCVVRTKTHKTKN